MVSYVERGQGRPVVMLHATLHDHRDFDPVAEFLSRDYRTIAVDWPGHGDSDTPDRVDAFLLAETLGEVLDEVAPVPVALIGNSVGGFAAARLAIDRPDRVLGLVLVNTGGFTRQTTVSRTACRLLGVPRVNRLLQPRLVPQYMRARNDHDRAVAERARLRASTVEGSRVAAALWRSFARPDYDLRGEAARITAPTLLVWGVRDVVLPAKAGRETHRAIPGSRLHTVETGHVAFASDPEGFLDIVTPFLASVTREGTPRKDVR
jgi:pimeloyl-ACP methyl ester carboxylesterase